MIDISNFSAHAAEQVAWVEKDISGLEETLKALQIIQKSCPGSSLNGSRIALLGGDLASYPHQGGLNPVLAIARVEGAIEGARSACRWLKSLAEQAEDLVRQQKSCLVASEEGGLQKGEYWPQIWDAELLLKLAEEGLNGLVRPGFGLAPAMMQAATQALAALVAAKEQGLYASDDESEAEAPETPQG